MYRNFAEDGDFLYIRMIASLDL